MHDRVEIIGQKSLIQHGRHNDRIYLMKLDEGETKQIISALSKLARQKGYSKIFCKIPKTAAPLFIADGYILEACIPHFYNGKKDVFFMSKFLSQERTLHNGSAQLEQLNNLLEGKSHSKKRIEDHSANYRIVQLNKTNAEQIVEIYKEVFESYPFPIHDAGYIRETMDDNVQYYGAIKNGEIGALASSEIDFKGLNAEMTDFATSQNHLGNNLSTLLLKTMEKAMNEQGIYTLYTIARLNSIPMNKTFLRAGYQYSGTLINNTNIAGKIESMNIFYKHI